MYRFLLGLIIGMAAASYLRLSERTLDWKIDQRLTDLQRRAASGAEESRRIFGETREELSDAAEVGMRSMQRKAERLRRAVEEPEGETRRPTG